MATVTVSAHRVSLGASVRDLRGRRGLTLRELAQVIGVSPATMSAIENGLTGTSSDRVADLADSLGVRVDRLYAGPEGGGEPLGGPSARVLPAAPRSPGVALDSWRHFPPQVLDPALSGALASFLELGYHGSTMRSVAERAGLSVAGLYHYYAGKQQLLLAILDLTMTDLALRTDAVLAETDDVVERFANLVECQALFHTHRRELGFVGASEMRSLTPEARRLVAVSRVREQRKVDHEVVAAARLGAFATTRPREAARAVVTMCTALAQWFRRSGGSTPEQIAEQYVVFSLDLVRCDPDRWPAPRRAGG